MCLGSPLFPLTNHSSMNYWHLYPHIFACTSVGNVWNQCTLKSIANRSNFIFLVKSLSTVSSDSAAVQPLTFLLLNTILFDISKLNSRKFHMVLLWIMSLLCVFSEYWLGFAQIYIENAQNKNLHWLHWKKMRYFFWLVVSMKRQKYFVKIKEDVWEIEKIIINTILFQQNRQFDSNVHLLNRLIYFLNEIWEDCQPEAVLTWGMGVYTFKFRSHHPISINCWGKMTETHETS